MKFTQAFKASKAAASYAQDAQAFRNADKRQMGRDVGRFAVNQGASTGKEAARSSCRPFENIIRSILRGTQFLLAIILIGCYGNRVDAERKDQKGFAPEWLFAVVVGGLSAITAVVFLALASAGSIPCVGSKFKGTKTYKAFYLDGILFVCWMVVFFIFHFKFRSYASDQTVQGVKVLTMRAAGGMDVISAAVWLLTAGIGIFKTNMAKKADKLQKQAADKWFGNDQQQQFQQQQQQQPQYQPNQGMYNYHQAV